MINYNELAECIQYTRYFLDDSEKRTLNADICKCDVLNDNQKGYLLSLLFE